MEPSDQLHSPGPK